MATSTTTLQMNDFIGWMKRNNRAARAARLLVQFFAKIFFPKMRPKSFGTFEKQVPQFPLYLRNGSKPSNFAVLLVSLTLKHVKRSAFQTKRNAVWQLDFGPESSLYYRETTLWWQREPQQQIFHCLPVPSGENREFKKLQPQLQRKRHIKLNFALR